FEFAVVLLVIGAVAYFLFIGPIRNSADSPTRREVSRVRMDMRTLTTALESYKLDHGAYPGIAEEAARAGDFPNGAGPVPTLHTPVAYTNSVYTDSFAIKEGETFAYYTDGDGWILISPGPDRIYD